MNLQLPSPDPKVFNPELPDYLAEAIMEGMQKDAQLRPQDMRSFIASIQPPQPRNRPRNGIRRFSKKKLLISAGFAGLVSYFMYQGIPRFYAEKLAEEKITQPKGSPSPIISPSPTVKPIDKKTKSIKEAINLYNQMDFQGCADFCSEEIHDNPKFYELYVMRAMSYATIARQHSKDRPKSKELYLKAESDLDMALQIVPPFEEISAETDFTPPMVLRIKDSITKALDIIKFLEKQK